MPAYALPAELLAEEIAAQQAAAALAAQQAAAAAEAAEAARIAQQTAQAAQAAQTAQATQTTTSGFQTLANEVGATTQPTGIDQLTQTFQQAQVNNTPMTGQEFLNNSFAGPPTAPPVESFVQPPAQPAPTLYGSQTQLPSYGQSIGPNTLPPIEAPLPVASSVEAGSAMADPYKPYDPRFGPQTPVPGGGGLPTAMTGASTVPTETGGLEGLWNSFKAAPLGDKLLMGSLAAGAYNMLNPPKPYERPKSLGGSAWRSRWLSHDSVGSCLLGL